MTAEKILNKYKGELETAAKEPILKGIYGEPEDKSFPRSHNTVDSVKVSAQGDVLTIYLDEESNLPFQYEYFGKVKPQGLKSYRHLTGGAYEIYPEYFMRGGGFTGVQFDFYEEWEDAVIPIIEKGLNEIADELVKEIIKGLK